MSRCLGQLHVDPLQLLSVRGLLLFRHCFLSMLRLPQWVILYWLSQAMLFLSNSLVAFVLGTNQEFHQLASLQRAHTCSHDYNARKRWMPNFKAATLLIFFFNNYVTSMYQFFGKVTSMYHGLYRRNIYNST